MSNTPTVNIYGKQPVYHYIENYPQKIKTLYIAKDLDKKEYSRLMRMGFEVKRIPLPAAQKMSKSANHQGFLADVESIQVHPLSTFRSSELILMLSNITDMGNIGALIRSAYALGVDGVVVCGIKHLNIPSIIRTSSGAAADIKIAVVNNLYDAMHEMDQFGFESYGAVIDGKDIRKVEMHHKRVLILGNEGEGLPNRAIEKLDHKVSIMMENGFDSLNVSAAGAILIDRLR